MENLIATLVLLFLGMAGKRLRLFPENGAQSLNLFVIYVALPALVLLKVPGLTPSADLLVVLVIPWLMLGVSALLVLGVSRYFGYSREIEGGLLLVVPMGNTSFLGIPMVNAFFGGDGIPYAVLYDQLGSFLALATYGTMVLALYGSGQARPTAAAIVRKIVTFPTFIALVAAVLLRPVAWPPPVAAVLGSISASLVPVVMVAVGMQLKLRLTPGTLHPFGSGLLLKLVVAPLLALAFCRLFAFDSLAARVAVFEAGMPPMVTAGALAAIAGLAPEFTAAIIGYGILFSFASLSLLYLLL